MLYRAAVDTSPATEGITLFKYQLLLLLLTVYKGERFYNQGILDIRTHFKPTKTFQYTHFSSCHPPGVRKGLIKGEALRLLRINSSAKSFYCNITNFKTRLRDRCYYGVLHLLALFLLAACSLLASPTQCFLVYSSCLA